MKHPGIHKVIAKHPLFQVLVFEGCQGEIINLLTMRKCRMGCYLCGLVYNFEFSFFRGLWMKLSDRHICVQQGFEMHVYVRSLVFNNIKIRLITFWPCLHFISSKV